MTEPDDAIKNRDIAETLEPEPTWENGVQGLEGWEVSDKGMYYRTSEDSIEHPRDFNRYPDASIALDDAMILRGFERYEERGASDGCTSSYANIITSGGSNHPDPLVARRDAAWKALKQDKL